MPLRNLAVLPMKFWRPDERRKIEDQNYATVEESFEYTRIYSIFYTVHYVLYIIYNLLYIRYQIKLVAISDTTATTWYFSFRFNRWRNCLSSMVLPRFLIKYFFLLRRIFFWTFSYTFHYIFLKILDKVAMVLQTSKMEYGWLLIQLCESRQSPRVLLPVLLEKW